MAHPAEHDSDDHDRGLAFDLGALIERRRLLGLVGVAGASAFLAACNYSFGGEANRTGKAADGSICLKDPAETEGPFPADGSNAKNGVTQNVLTQSGVMRQDVRTSFAGMTPVADGVPVDLTITLVDISKSCALKAGHVVYIWHCDAEGRYSLYDATDRNYLRGVGITDDTGVVKFTTVFPGCYPGRWPHIHFEVFADQAAAVAGKASLLVSQFALPGDVAKTLYDAVQIYSDSVANLAALSLDRDLVFSDNTAKQKSAMTLKLAGDAKAGFKATGTIGIATA